jgi:hypothetical protein
VLRLEDLPPGFSPVTGAPAPSALPDGLARQAVAEFNNGAEGQPTTIRQTVMRFDGRDALEYEPHFRDLMVRHQGYTLAAGSDEATFKLTRMRGDEQSVVVGQANGDVLIITTVTGPAGTIGMDQAASFTDVAAGRAGPASASYAARAAQERNGLSLENAGTKVPYLGLPAVNGSRRWPMPTSNLPAAPTINVIQPRSREPKDEPELSVMAPVPPPRRATPTGRPILAPTPRHSRPSSTSSGPRSSPL